jgi:type I restriction enzyme S subunit
VTGLSPRQVSSKTWLRHVPPNQVLRFKDIFEIRKRPNGSSTPQVLSLTNKGIIERDISSNEGQLAESYDNYQVVEIGDFVLNPMDLLAGWVARSSFEGVISNAYFVFRLRSGASTIRSNPVFYELLLQSYYANGILEPFGKGVGRPENGGGRWTLNSETLSTIPFPNLPLLQQDEIVDFLDRELSAIDTLAHKFSELLHKSKELRRSSIFHLATTPESNSSNHSAWKFGKVKHLAKISSGRNFPVGTVLESGDTPVYGGNGVRGFTNDSPDFNEARVVIGRVGAHCGNTHVTSPYFSASEHCLVLEPKTKYDNVWLASYLEALNLGSLSQSAAQPLVTGGDIRDLSISIPPFETQKAVGLKITAKLQEIDHLTEQIVNLLALIGERRSALISEAVTGKMSAGRD